MYNVYLVEDQPILRETTRISDIWSGDQFNLCGVAANGRDAWEQIRQMDVDIVITDISMPFLDGLELTRLLRRHFPRIRVILISGYNDFEYARQAVSAGVTEYVLKPIRTTDLLPPLRKAAADIDRERSGRTYLRQMEQKVNAAESLRRLQLLVDMSLEAKPLSELRERARALGIPVERSHVVAAVVKSDGAGRGGEMSGPLLAAEMETMIAEFLAGREGVHVFNRNGRDVRLLFLGGPGDADAAALMDDVSGAMEKVRALLSAHFPGVRLMACIGSLQRGIEGVAKSFTSADMALSMRFMFDGREALNLNRPMSGQLAPRRRDRFAHLAAERNRMLHEVIDAMDPQKAPGVVRALCEGVEQSASAQEQRLYAYMDLVGYMHSLLPADAAAGETDGNRAFLFLIENIDDRERIAAHLIEEAARVIAARREGVARRGGDVIEKVRRFIDEHYADPEISLTAAAAHANVSVSHLSALYSRECGKTFSKCLMVKRVEEAKRLLQQTDKYISEIAFEVGYDDSNYFSKVFKRIIGQTPVEFRSARRG